MNITKFEQSGFIIETESGFRFGFDIGNKTPLEKLEGVTPLDVLLISHIHGDHFSLPHIQYLSPKKLYLNQECLESAGEESLASEVLKVSAGDEIYINESVKVIYFEVDHGPNISAPVENMGFLIEVDGQKIYFAGDMFYESGMDVSGLEVDIALIPVGTFYTFGPEEAFSFAKRFKKIGKIIPMHYEKTPETKGQFCELVKGDFDLG